MRAQSTFSQAFDGALVATSSTTPDTFSAYGAIVNRLIYTLAERDEMIKECHRTLARTGPFTDQIPDFVFNELYSHIIKYVYRYHLATNRLA
ncbi:hypothetical protein AB4Z35_13590 [Pseudomonas sp. KB_15]|uniref:hypothetical protein n=1 Tax=Pseudomonas sp. KB_15 TaxID=3233035 RepID=UPI003F9DAD43